MRVEVAPVWAVGVALVIPLLASWLVSWLGDFLTTTLGQNAAALVAVDFAELPVGEGSGPARTFRTGPRVTRRDQAGALAFSASYSPASIVPASSRAFARTLVGRATRNRTDDGQRVADDVAQIEPEFSHYLHSH
ncbi:hypothetical protein [Micropruina sonneratiae]|uniref:hypothetical protein n=1 Tax=Micropruina sonneratiae TaxID=2986940 RepID=UPI002227CCC3|nr:hypothetical protein [Micropruina sp. KQZ13P-5]MCW3157669.1 hypothetical protein [Micropruina sp. KQZ13P-5]